MITWINKIEDLLKLMVINEELKPNALQTWQHIDKLFLNMLKSYQVPWLKRTLLWKYLKYSLTRGLQKGNSIYEIEMKMRRIFRKTGDKKRYQKFATIRAERVFTHIAKYIVGNSVLDVGAGNGLIGQVIHQKMGKEVTLTDTVDYNISSLPLMLYPQNGTIPLKDNEVDTSIVYLVLHHSKDPELLLSEVKRVTKKRIIIMEGYIDQQQALDTNSFFDWFLNRIVQAADIDIYLNYKTIKQWNKIFNKLEMESSHHEIKGIDEPLAPEEHVFFSLNLQN